MGVSRIHKRGKGRMSAAYTKGVKGECQQNTQKGSRESVSRIHKRGKGRVSAEYTKEVKGGCQQNTQKG